MLKYALLTLALATLTTCRPSRRHHDPFSDLDHHISHSIGYHLWPWSQLMKFAAALDGEEHVEPKIVSDPEKYQINLRVRNFKPEELKVKVKNRYVLIEGRHQDDGEYIRPFTANHFVERFILPPGTKQDEVTAVFKDKSVLTVTAPKHDVPPPPPERLVPIQVLVTEDKKEEKPVSSDKPEAKPENPIVVKPVITEVPMVEDKPATAENSSKVDKPVIVNHPVIVEKPVENPVTEVKPLKEVTEVKISNPVTLTPPFNIDVVDTKHDGKIRKKDLKTTKDNLVNKGVEENDLDYALIEKE